MLCVCVWGGGAGVENISSEEFEEQRIEADLVIFMVEVGLNKVSERRRLFFLLCTCCCVCERIGLE